MRSFKGEFKLKKIIKVNTKNQNRQYRQKKSLYFKIVPMGWVKIQDNKSQFVLGHLEVKTLKKNINLMLMTVQI